MYEEYESYTDTLKRENSVLSEELKSLQEQVSERGMDKFEMSMSRSLKRLESWREESSWNTLKSSRDCLI